MGGAAEADYLFHRGRFDEAERGLRRLLASDSAQPDARAKLAICLLEQDALTDALREAHAAVEQGGERPYTHFALARALARLGQVGDAEGALATAVELDPWDAEFLAFQAELELRQGLAADALETAERGLALDGDHWACLAARSAALIALEAFDEAAEPLLARLAVDPDDAKARAALGGVRAGERRWREAEGCFLAALELEPESPPAQVGLLQALCARRPILRLIVGLSRAAWIGGLAEPARVLLLGLSPLGRLSLSASERRSVPWLLACALATVIGAALAVAEPEGPGAWVGGAGAALALLISLTFRFAPGPRGVLAVTTGGLAALAATALAAPSHRSRLALVFVVGVSLTLFLGGLRPAFLHPRLGALAPAAELAERRRWRRLAAAALAAIALAGCWVTFA